jgi:ribosomal protein S17
MPNLDQVVSSIKSMSKEQLKEVYDAYAIRMSEVRYNEKSSFKIGDIVKINHKSVSQEDTFRIIKVMTKNIKVVKTNVAEGRIAGEIRVSPGLLQTI